VTVTIQWRDWNRDVRYEYSCDCLLARSVKRTLKSRRAAVEVFMGEVYVRTPRTNRVYVYDPSEYEWDLIAAHHDPSLLPMTIRLR